VIGPDPTPIEDASPTFYKEQAAGTSGPIGLGDLAPLQDEGEI